MKPIAHRRLNPPAVCAAAMALIALAASAFAADSDEDGKRARLMAAYPDHIKAIEGNEVVFKDDTRLPYDDRKGVKPYEQWVETPDIEDMTTITYRPGGPAAVPAINDDPGRARNADFFAKIYGDCRKGETDKNMTDVVWLPKKSGRKLKATSVNRVAERLQAVSNELDLLPDSFNVDLMPPAGTYTCRQVAGTSSMSAHSYGIAIDIALKNSHYWRWDQTAATKAPVYKNAIPLEIVTIFEKHGFIWGGKWYHYDTMHFEYRPELLPPAP
ncbi:MAG: M15 family metallopeptidase [Hyphomicrobium sp.]